MGTSNKNFKSVAFPREHGSWGFVLEPLTLAVVIAFNTNGLFIALSAFFIFLAHQPVRIILKKGVTKHLKQKAVFFLTFYFLSAAFFIIQPLRSENPIVLVPLTVVVILMMYFLYLETVGTARGVYAELIGPVSMDLVAFSIVISGNWSFLQAIAFLVVLLNRSVPTTFYIHEKLNSIKNINPDITRLNIITIIGFILVIGLAFAGYVPRLSILAVLVLWIRSVYGFTEKAKKQTVRQIGMLEFLYGTVFVIINAIGYLTGL